MEHASAASGIEDRFHISKNGVIHFVEASSGDFYISRLAFDANETPPRKQGGHACRPASRERIEDDSARFHRTRQFKQQLRRFPGQVVLVGLARRYAETSGKRAVMLQNGDRAFTAPNDIFALMAEISFVRRSRTFRLIPDKQEISDSPSGLSV